MKIYLFFTLLLTISFVSLFSQGTKKDSLMAMNRKFKNEIGVDFKNLFKENVYSANIIWKRKKAGRLVSLTFSNNYRFQLGLNGDINFMDKTIKIDTNYYYQYYVEPKTRLGFYPKFGMERINFFGRFNTYYGIDIGPYYENWVSGYSFYNSTWSFYREDHLRTGLSFIPFIGAKYRISERFSASLESAFDFSYYYLRKKLIALPWVNNSQVSDGKVVLVRKIIAHSFDAIYLRFLALNYHF